MSAGSVSVRLAGLIRLTTRFEVQIGMLATFLRGRRRPGRRCVDGSTARLDALGVSAHGVDHRHCAWNGRCRAAGRVFAMSGLGEHTERTNHSEVCRGYGEMVRLHTWSPRPFHTRHGLRSMPCKVSPRVIAAQVRGRACLPDSSHSVSSPLYAPLTRFSLTLITSPLGASMRPSLSVLACGFTPAKSSGTLSSLG